MRAGVHRFVTCLRAVAMAACVVSIAVAAARAQTPPPAAPQPAPASPAPKADTFSALLFGDYYWFAKDHDPAWEDQQGFWLRRIYLTWDHRFSPSLVTRVRFELNGNGQLKSGSVTPYLKDAYLRWTYAGRQQLTLGMQPTPAIDALDAFWGMRHIEKTALDLYKWDSTRDFAIAGSGPIDRRGRVRYVVQFGNESGTEAEINSSKALRAALRYQGESGLVVAGSASRFHHVSHADWVTAEAHVGYSHRRGRAGAQFGYQLREHGDFTALPDVTQRVVSVFAVLDPLPKKLSAFYRMDVYLDRCPTCASLNYLPIDPSAPFTFGLAGVEYYLHPSVRISPNVEWIAYGNPAAAGAPTPKTDIVFRTTFYWVW